MKPRLRKYKTPHLMTYQKWQPLVFCESKVTNTGWSHEVKVSDVRGFNTQVREK